MAKKISSLSVQLGATVAPFVTAFRGARSSVTGLTSTLGVAHGAILKWTGLGAIVGGVIGGFTFASAVREQMDLVDSSAKLADRLGIATEALAGLEAATQMSNISREVFIGGIEKMMRGLSATGTAGVRTAKAYAQLGLSSAALAKLPMDQVFATIADRIKGLDDPLARSKAAVDIFGRSGARLLPLLMSGSEGIAAAVREAERLGLTFSRVDAAKIEQANDAIFKMKSVATGVFRSLAIAVAPFIDTFATKAKEMGISVVAGLRTFVPMVISWTRTIWGVITTSWQTISSFLRPIISGIGAFIARNWRVAVESTTMHLSAMWNLVSSIFGVVWELVKTVASGIYITWNEAMRLLGLDSLQLATSVGGAFQTISDWAMWLRDKFTLAMNVMAYTIKNWRLTLDIAVTGATLSIVTFANQVTHFFTEVIPTVLTWFADNWETVLDDMFHFSKIVFENTVANIIAILTSLPDLLSGKVSFADLWTPIGQGFTSALTSLPVIAEREIGGLEAALASDLAGLENEFGAGLAKMLADEEAFAKGTVKAVEGAGDALGAMLKVPEVAMPTVPPIVAAVDVDTSAMDEATEKAKTTQAEMKAIFAGSAEAQRTRLQAQFAARVSKPVVESPEGAGKVAGEQKEQSKLLEKVRETIAEGNAEQIGLLEQLVGLGGDSDLDEAEF